MVAMFGRELVSRPWVSTAKNHIRGYLNTHNLIFYFRFYGGRRTECWQKHKRFIIYYNSLLMNDINLARNFYFIPLGRKCVS